MPFLQRGSRTSQPIVLKEIFDLFNLSFLQTHVAIVRFAEIHEETFRKQSFGGEASRPPAMAGVD